jgi:fatty-acid peroxygenase
MTQIPREKSPDSTLALILDPYGFISKRCLHHHSDLFQGRLMFQDAIFMSGPEAAELFYDQDRFMRSGALPARIQKTLFGQGGVQGLDNEAHRHRKQMFMSLMTPERIGRLTEVTAGWWRTYARRWTSMDKIVLYDELHTLLNRSVCSWAGVPLEEPEIDQRTREITPLFEYAGSIGLKHWRSRLARKRAERWIAGVIEQIRAERLRPPEQSAVNLIAWHRDLDSRLLNPRVAAVEVLNVVRPTVAVAVYITFIAHALHQYPECRAQLRSGAEGYAHLFVQEVRRFYPFFPSVMARVRHDFEWKGYPFPRGRRVILDLYGTNHDARTWAAPDQFRPERFRQWNGSPFNFIPQGGGDHYVHHRCAGEWVTIDLMKAALVFLTEHMKYEVPEQDLRIDYSQMPALPRSRFIISNVETKS